MVLTQFSIVKAKPAEKPYKLADGGGLHLLVRPGGGKLWRFRYRFGGRENMLALGPFPAVSLAAARDRRDEAKKLIAAGTDPSDKRKLDRLTEETANRNTFGALVAEYISRLQEKGSAKSTIDKNRWLLEDLAASLANRPISAITPAEILLLLQRIEKTGRRETARRLRGMIGSVFRHAVVTMRATNDPTFALRGALLPPKVQHRARSRTKAIWAR
jgi:hypothetical protein